MKVSTVVFASVLTMGLAAAFTGLPVLTAAADMGKGKVEKVEREGRIVHIGGKKVRISGSRTNVCLAGKCDEDRAKIKAGMECEYEAAMRKGRFEAKKMSCK